MQIRPILIVLITLLLMACSAHRTSISEDGSESIIYDADESKVFNIVYSSIQEVFPEEKISVITAPVRGYITKFLAPPLYADWFTHKILVHRGAGIDSNGNKATGYWLEVSGNGSSFLQGQAKNKAVYETILRHLNTSTQKRYVTSITPAEYTVPQENFYIRGADTLEGDGARVIMTQQGGDASKQTQAEKLRDLKKLYDDGVLSDEEYQTTKSKILNSY